jgi:RNA polymerase sigma-70 factor (ECF subfamily)
MHYSSGESRLIEGFLRGDTESVGILDGWTDVVLWQCARSLREEWDDLKQEVRTRTFRNLSRGAFDGDSGLRTYVHRIAKNVCIDALRVQWRQRERDVSLPANSPVFVSPARADSAGIAGDLLSKLLAGFSDEDRALLTLVFVEHRSYSEVALHLAIPEGTVKSRMFRCKNRIVQRRKELLGREDAVK